MTSLDPSLAMVSPATISFTPTNYAGDQALTVTASSDPDAVDASTTIRVESISHGLSTDVPVTIDDDEILAIETDVTAVSFAEATSATFQVRLTAQPLATTTVAVVSSDPAAASVSPAMLTFTTASWAAYQTVTVSGVADGDLSNETVTVSLTASDMPVVTVAGDVTDDDAQVVLVTPATLTVGEAGSGTLNVSLQYAPTGSVTVNVVSSAPTVATVSPATLTFTVANYATPQVVTVSGVDDIDVIAGAATVTASVVGGTPGSSTITVTDDDVVGLQTSVPTLTVGEAGTATFGVRLTAQPAAGTTVTIASTDVGAATASPTTLTFTPADWNVYQTVTVTGVNDADLVNESLAITISGPSIGASVTVAVTDDDTQAIIVSAATVTAVDGGGATFGVRLQAQPGGSVTVNIASGDTGAATVTPSSLTFSAGNWNVLQNVTVSGVADQDLASESVTITVSSTGLTSMTVTATITDDDSQEVVTSTGSLSVTEGGTNTATVSLRFVPPGNVTVTLTSSAPGVATVAPASMTFTPANYNVGQTITVAGVEDADTSNGAATVTATAVGAAPATIAVTVIDNDVLGLEVASPTLTVAEGGSATVGVRTTAQPAATTTVTVSSSDVGAAAALPASLTFTTANWNVYQNVTVAGVSDLDAANESVTDSMASTGHTTDHVAVTITDDETQLILHRGCRGSRWGQPRAPSVSGSPPSPSRTPR